jgi:ArsR family transcriptional regulator
MLSEPTLPRIADDEQLAALAKALAHPARLKILALLARTPGRIEGQIDPPRVCYALAPGALAPLAELIVALQAASSDPACCVTPDNI